MLAFICNPGLVGLSRCFGGLTAYQSKNKGKVIIKKNVNLKYDVVEIAGCGNNNDALLGTRETYKEALKLKETRRKS